MGRVVSGRDDRNIKTVLLYYTVIPLQHGKSTKFHRHAAKEEEEETERERGGVGKRRRSEGREHGCVVAAPVLLSRVNEDEQIRRTKFVYELRKKPSLILFIFSL